MEKEKKISEEEENIEEPIELVLFQVSECYVYLRDGFQKQFADIPPRKSAASYRADEWNVNKWAWEGVLKVISKGEECIIRLEDKTTGELYARSFLREGEPHPVEAVIDSSRYFVLRIEENIGGRLRHAFIGIGFRERTEAYDFQAALHDHMKFLSVIMNDIVSERNELNLYLNKKKAAEEMEQQYQKSSSTDYRLKEGETIVLQLKNKSGSGGTRSKFFDQVLNNLSLEEKSNKSAGVVSIRPPPPPGGSLSPVISPKMPPSELPSKLNLENTAKEEPRESAAPEKESEKDIIDDDFGDFQTAV